MSFYRSWIGGGGEAVKKYTSSLVDDVEIAEATVEVLKAHVRHLAEVKAIPKEAAEAIEKALGEVRYEELVGGGFEDIHEALEKWLVDRLGPETAWWVGLGRSRNDHVAAAIRLTALRKAAEVKKAAAGLICVLVEKALQYRDCPMPSFTHFQPAQVVTYGHYLLAVAELTEEFLQLLDSVEWLLYKSPLGAGPAGGVKTPIDREALAREAGFKAVVENALYASGGRLFALALASTTVSYLAELSRAVDDFIRWSSPVVGYIEPPLSHVSTSSIMPHKKNPVTLEVFRARSGEAVGHLMAMFTIVSKIGLGYSLDLQEATRHLWAVLKIVKEGLEVLTEFIKEARFNCQKAREDAEAYFTTSSDTVEIKALAGVPFRIAYFQLAEEIKRGQAELLTVEEALQRPTKGSASPKKVEETAAKYLPLCLPRPL